MAADLSPEQGIGNTDRDTQRERWTQRLGHRVRLGHWSSHRESNTDTETQKQRSCHRGKGTDPVKSTEERERARVGL